MTIHDWQQHVTSKGIKQNDAVMMLNDAKAEIEQLRAVVRKRDAEIYELRDTLRIIANHTADPGTALETVVKFAAATIEVVE